MGGACSPPASPRGGLWRDVVSEAALHYCSRKLLLVLFGHSVGFLLLYTPVLIHRKQTWVLLICVHTFMCEMLLYRAVSTVV